MDISVYMCGFNKNSCFALFIRMCVYSVHLFYFLDVREGHLLQALPRLQPQVEYRNPNICVTE